MPQSRTINAALAISVPVLLAGCQDFRELGSSLHGALAPPDKAATDPSRPGSASAKPGAEIVGLDVPAVKRVQAQLGKLGFEPGPIDGVVGLRTTRAVERYQARFRLPVTGKITSRLLEHLEATTAGSGSRPVTRPAAIQPPAYRPATTFVYSDGGVERVASTNRSSIQWLRRDGATYTAHRNFMLPRTSWMDSGERGSARIAGKPDTLWPEIAAAEASFSADVTVQRRDGSEWTEQQTEKWRCRNEGPREITVPSGTFETVLFACLREAQHGEGELRRAWYYADQVGHYVRFVETGPQEDAARTTDLVAVRPGAASWPPIVRAALARAVVKALEDPGRNVRTDWSSSAVDTRVTIEAKARFVTPDGRSCRRFNQTWSEGEHSRQYPAVACRTDAGRWEIPFLGSDNIDSLATSGEIPFRAPQRIRRAPELPGPTDSGRGGSTLNRTQSAPAGQTQALTE